MGGMQSKAHADYVVVNAHPASLPDPKGARQQTNTESGRQTNNDSHSSQTQGCPARTMGVQHSGRAPNRGKTMGSQRSTAQEAARFLSQNLSQRLPTASHGRRTSFAAANQQLGQACCKDTPIHKLMH
eukprot:CAMPEP_0174381074 /NCGR_PEP_ID=MMETSP0811_2-20130205/123780_1 /TAXON_ID=73025 ORGANISM="Eutreptiella gymnastica-like, Strain CCMP1594" /NCGR_SAMPLE_ID=MMETSP0811_2 /ASSEMBLY_ACC=CAM_ASM_000667 /LENGTH=127 /DNA_ID=CAMNT_0015534117 /DNA_START=26 /DNA_END=409 /DNA_ORIENTATION=-